HEVSTIRGSGWVASFPSVKLNASAVFTLTVYLLLGDEATHPLLRMVLTSCHPVVGHYHPTSPQMGQWSETLNGRTTPHRLIATSLAKIQSACKHKVAPR